MGREDGVHGYIERHTEELVHFLTQYLSIKSVNTGIAGEGQEGEVQDWLADRLAEYGFRVDKWAVDPEGRRPNVVATLPGAGGGRDLIFNGHSDVVPEIEVWERDPWKPVLEDGKLFARGSSDMKGGNAAAIWALRAIKECGVTLKGDVHLQFVVGEESNEGGTIGTAAAVDRGYRAPFAVVVEPTNLEIHVKSSSLFFFEIEIHGKSVHNSSRNQVLFPQPYGVQCGSQVGVDALQKALPFIDLFYRMEREWNHRWQDPVLGAGGVGAVDRQGVGVFTMNPALIEGGNYLGAVPGRVKVTYGVWYPPQVSVEKLWDEIRDKVRALASTDDWLNTHPPRVNVPVLQEWKGFSTFVDEPGVTLLREVFREALDRDPVVSGFKAVCDATYLGEKDIPAVVCGPGAISYGVHGADEFLPVSELVEAAKLYASFMAKWSS